LVLQVAAGQEGGVRAHAYVPVTFPGPKASASRG
jgi:hypothetical protein